MCATWRACRLSMTVSERSENEDGSHQVFMMLKIKLVASEEGCQAAQKRVCLNILHVAVRLPTVQPTFACRTSFLTLDPPLQPSSRWPSFSLLGSGPSRFP